MIINDEFKEETRGGKIFIRKRGEKDHCHGTSEKKEKTQKT
jgi:hypothetical protein